MKNEYLILGAGVAGLSAGMNTGKQIYEANDFPGGICASYYMNSNGRRFYYRNDEKAYRFEVGGGHWIFGADDSTLDFMDRLSCVKSYERRSAVYFPARDLYVPYPLQNHLSHLPEDIARRALDEIVKSDHTKNVSTLADWLVLHFGKTLCELFFFPFHQLYTAGLFTKIEPQDRYKTPVDKEQIIKGFDENTSPVGYNAIFVYPERGLDDLMRKMAERCKVDYYKEVTEIDTKKRQILFEDGTATKYKALISTLPLNKVVKLTNLTVKEAEPPYTSVLVINIGAKKGSKCPDYHWLYIPKSKMRFHRIGFYSNVDSSFLPISSREDDDKVSIYLEKAYLPEEKPEDEEIKRLCDDIVKELQSWKFINETEVIDPTWIEVAYTWSYPGSKWRERATKLLKQNDIHQIGRYGSWQFQGIAESMRNGLEVNYGR